MNFQIGIVHIGIIILAIFGPNFQGTELQASAATDSPAGETAVVSIYPVALSAPGRGEDLQLRVSAPISGSKLPAIIFAHGNGMSANDYAPLVNYWAAHGFVVVQPTFLDAKILGLGPDDPRSPAIWRFRVKDMKRVIDDFAIVEASIPGLKGRVDRSRIAAVGHSYGGLTTAMLLGAQIIGTDGKKEDLSDRRIKAGVLLSTAGNGGKNLSAFAAKNFPFMNPSYTEMAKPTLVIAGDRDISRLTVRGPDWFTDAYVHSSNDKCLATLFGGEHMLGGISGAGVTATTDENAARVTAVQRLSLAFLQSALYPGNEAWPKAHAAMNSAQNAIGRVECK